MPIRVAINGFGRIGRMAFRAIAKEAEFSDIEVVAINDGSRDRTGELLNALAARFPRLRVVHQLENQGKAVGLNTAALLTKAEILVGIDGDARLDPYSLHWLVRHFDAHEVGAVTGNPRVRNRSTLLGRIQVGEFSSIVGLIKRAQRSVGLIFTVSGVITAFRRSALHEVGYWSPEKLTEDVDISWKLQLAGWEVRFEPRALCWILMPETLGGLWKQRLRWSMGGSQVLLDYTPQLLSPKNAGLERIGYSYRLYFRNSPYYWNLCPDDYAAHLPRRGICDGWTICSLIRRRHPRTCKIGTSIVKIKLL